MPYDTIGNYDKRRILSSGGPGILTLNSEEKIEHEEVLEKHKRIVLEADARVLASHNRLREEEARGFYRDKDLFVDGRERKVLSSRARNRMQKRKQLKAIAWMFE